MEDDLLMRKFICVVTFFVMMLEGIAQSSCDYNHSVYVDFDDFILDGKTLIGKCVHVVGYYDPTFDSLFDSTKGFGSSIVLKKIDTLDRDTRKKLLPSECDRCSVRVVGKVVSTYKNGPGLDVTEITFR